MQARAASHWKYAATVHNHFGGNHAVIMDWLRGYYACDEVRQWFRLSFGVEMTAFRLNQIRQHGIVLFENCVGFMRRRCRHSIIQQKIFGESPRHIENVSLSTQDPYRVLSTVWSLLHISSFKPITWNCTLSWWDFLTRQVGLTWSAYSGEQDDVIFLYLRRYTFRKWHQKIQKLQQVYMDFELVRSF
jgi:hypothetical protein